MPFKKKLTISIISITAVSLILLAVLFITYKLLKISYNTSEKNVIDSQIIITRSSKGIPHIEAATVDDFYFALGYLHAKDRLDIMEYLRAIANGETDKFAANDSTLLNNISRTIGFTKNADDITAKLKKDEIQYLSSYVKGINHVRGNAHVGIIISREWTIQDVLSIISMKEWANSYLNNVELIFNLDDSKLQLLKNLFDDNKYLHFYNEADNHYLYILRRIKEITEKYICTFLRGNAVYSGPEYSLTGTDSYISLNYEDSFNLYPGWYPLKATINGKKILAVTYNGLPFLLSFKNDNASLTQINVNADTQNFYFFESENKNNISQYKSAGKWQAYKTARIPAFANNGSASEIKWYTDKGPVISDLISSVKSDNRILVLESIQPGNEYISAMIKMPFETDIEKIKQLALVADSSLKCFIISDKNKAYKIYSGHINQTGNNNRIFTDGSKSFKAPLKKIAIASQIKTPDFIGSDIIPSKELPGLNQNVITNLFKMEHFNNLLLKKKQYNEDLIRDFITDDISVTAEKFIPLFKLMLENNVLTSAKLSKIYFSDWDFSTNRGLQAPSIFFTTLSYLTQETYRDKFGHDSDFNLASSYLLYPELYNQCQKKLTNIFDNTDTIKVESREMIFDIAFLSAMRFLNRKSGPYMESWRWGEINKATFNIHNAKSDIFSRFMHVDDKQFSGGSDTIQNLTQNNKLSPISATSFYCYITDDALKFKMVSGYSISMLSDFFYGNTKIESFENLDVTTPVYKTVINKL